MDTTDSVGSSPIPLSSSTILNPLPLTMESSSFGSRNPIHDHLNSSPRMDPQGAESEMMLDDTEESEERVIGVIPLRFSASTTNLALSFGHGSGGAHPRSMSMSTASSHPHQHPQFLMHRRGDRERAEAAAAAAAASLNLGIGPRRRPYSLNPNSSNRVGNFGNRSNSPECIGRGGATNSSGPELNQGLFPLKRSSSEPWINKMGIDKEVETQSGSDLKLPIIQGLQSGEGCSGSTSGYSSVSSTSGSGVDYGMSSSGSRSSGSNKEMSMELEIDGYSVANTFLGSFNSPRPRRFSASFSPGSPSVAPSRVSQLRCESSTDWEREGEKEFHGSVNIAQSWEDLSIEPMAMDVVPRRQSLSDQLWLSMPQQGNASPSASASSSPAASPRVISRFSPSLSCSSPTRKSFTTRRSLSPIAVRPSVLTMGQSQGLKRKCDWDSSSSPNSQMDCSSGPAAKRVNGLLGVTPPGLPQSNNWSPTYNPSFSLPIQIQNSNLSFNPFSTPSPTSLEGTPSSPLSISNTSGGRDSPFFRHSPLNYPSDRSSDSGHPS